jgi:Zn-dependent alcohol dehydrogenase
MPHAMQIRQTRGPEVLNGTAVDVGKPGSGQVRLRQAAAGLNYIDVYHRTGYYPQPLPFIPGLEGQWAAAFGATVIGTVSLEACATSGSPIRII